jgi:hypothetical protein
MTEQELCLTLGLLEEPSINRLPITEDLAYDIRTLKMVFDMAQSQRQPIGLTQMELWLDFLPWHSLN